jgi:hypothetical protein
MRNPLNQKILSKLVFLGLIAFFSFCTSPLESEASSSYSEDIQKSLESMAIEDLSPLEQEGLIFMREEEKLARDVYLTFYEFWNQRVFNNIAKSEQRHTDAVLLLLERYDIADPVESDEIGSFKNQELQKLYDELIEKGKSSLTEALKVGAVIVEIDILDLQKQIEEIVDNEDIKFVYGKLQDASENHLRAFVRNLNSQGEEYIPQYLDGTVFEEIISSENHRGGKGNRIRGMGRG